MRAAVFCGSARGSDSVYVEQTRRLVKVMADREVDLIYGGGRVGLMGSLANEAIEVGLHIIGVMPKSLVTHELAHTDINELKVVQDMHERKSVMAEHADFFIALPGGAGTLEEIFEVWTWAQLGFHNKACAFYNINGYFDPLLAFFKKMVVEGFMQQSYLDMLVVSDSPERLIEEALSYIPPNPKWGS
ncbi:TIGR00730 family Rossman fold protein [Rosenbergiella epipactidis]|uniref:LOG family protein n=1 Tax=Rosenbergiella epipactidis TaxID=1544694 RepID=UPI001F4E4AA4|nr:TIGR00730 family Rossman fold protein [Rosenbergiella epipactidis]